MKENSTELIIIIDKSGSMSGLEKDVVGGYKTLIESQKKIEGETKVTTIFFDSKAEKIVNREDINAIKDLTEDDYKPNGCTALLDAVGNAITETKITLANTKEESMPEHVIFSIMTDGYENSSREYTYKLVKTLIQEQKKQGWEFLFQAANIDEKEEGEKLGIDIGDCKKFRANSEGIKYCFQMVAACIENIKNKK